MSRLHLTLLGAHVGCKAQAFRSPKVSVATLCGGRLLYVHPTGPCRLQSFCLNLVAAADILDAREPPG